VGQHGEDLLAISGPLFRRYAERIGARYHVFRVAESQFPCGEKFRVRGAVEHYDRVIYLDADIVLDPATCPDLFSIVSRETIGTHDDLLWSRVNRSPERNAEFVDWAQGEHDQVCDSQGIPRVTVSRMLNSGVLVLSREHAGFFDSPPRPLPKLHCAEQWWCWLNAHRYQFPLTLLHETFNYQWWFHERMPSPTERRDIHIRHYAGQWWFRSVEDRLETMRQHVRELGL
jgi:hypothetical protein